MGAALVGYIISVVFRRFRSGVRSRPGVRARRGERRRRGGGAVSDTERERERERERHYDDEPRE